MAGAGYCPTCGIDRRQGDRFCRNCGRDLVTLAASDEVTEAGIRIPAGEPTRPLETMPAGSSSVASLPPPPPAPPTAPSTTTAPPAAVVPPAARRSAVVRPVALAGAVALLVGLALPWTQGEGAFGATAFDIPVQFLWDFRRFDGTVKVGLVLSALGILAGLLCFFPATGWFRRVCGSVALIVAVAFVVQIFRGVDAFGGTLADLLDTLGAGIYVTVAGAIALQVSR